MMSMPLVGALPAPVACALPTGATGRALGAMTGAATGRDRLPLVMGRTVAPANPGTKAIPPIAAQFRAGRISDHVDAVVLDDTNPGPRTWSPPA